MANIYVRSGATGGTNAGTSWANAYLTLLSAATGAAAGDDIWVAADHAESLTAHTAYGFPGTAVAPNRIMCAIHTGSVPPVAADLRTTASITSNGSFSIQNIGGAFYMRGIQFFAGVGSASTVALSTSTDGMARFFELCTFSIASTGSSSSLTFQGQGVLDLLNCTFNFSSTGQKFITSAGQCRVRGGSTTFTGSQPSPLFWCQAGKVGSTTIDGIDLSYLGTGKTLCGGGNTGWKWTFIDCRLNALVTPHAVQAGPGGPTDFINCGSGATNYLHSRYAFEGTLTTETVIVRTGTDAESETGASDGTTPYSHKLVSTANAKPSFPFDPLPLIVWNDDVGTAKTVTIELLTDNVTLTSADLWADVSYLSSASYPLAAVASNAPATVLSAGSTLATSTIAWTTTGLTTPTKQKITVTFTPQMKGWVRVQLRLAKASTTVYVDPNLTVT